MSDIELHRSGPSQYCDHEVWHAYQNKGVNAPSSYGFEENWRLVTDELVEVKFKTSGQLLIILEESIEYTLNE